MNDFWNSICAIVPNAVIVATHSPGFSTNLSRWRLIIDEEGNLHQDTNVWEWSEEKGIVKERREEQAYIGLDEVTHLLRKAREVLRQPIPEPNIIREGAAANTIVVRIEDNPQKVSSEAEGFSALWQDIHRHAPYSPN